MSRESLTASWYQTFVVYQLVKSFYPRIIAVCDIHSIIVGLRLELSGLGRLVLCYVKLWSRVLSFEVEVLL